MGLRRYELGLDVKICCYIDNFIRIKKCVIFIFIFIFVFSSFSRVFFWLFKESMTCVTTQSALFIAIHVTTRFRKRFTKHALDVQISGKRYQWELLVKSQFEDKRLQRTKKPSSEMSSVLRSAMLRRFQSLRATATRTLTSQRVGFAPTGSQELRDPLPPALLTFKDPRAFQSKTWWELIRALGVFRLCSYPVLVNNCGKVSGAKSQL